jgi:hypothetical protein
MVRVEVLAENSLRLMNIMFSSTDWRIAAELIKKFSILPNNNAQAAAAPGELSAVAEGWK